MKKLFYSFFPFPITAAVLCMLCLVTPSAVHSQVSGCYVDFNWVHGTGATTINFSDASQFDTIIPPTVYMWDFGDGGTSSDPDPVHIYSDPGTYLVCLTVYNGNVGPYCCSDSACKYVTVGKLTGVSPLITSQSPQIFFNSENTFPQLIVNVSHAGKAGINLYNSEGELLMKTISVQLQEGRNEIPIYQSLPRGIYIAQLTINGEVISSKLEW